MKPELVIIIVLGLFAILFAVFIVIPANRYIDSHKNGPSFPEGCWKKYPLNTTYLGQQIRADKNNCYTKDLCQSCGKHGQNLYIEIKWDRIKEVSNE